MMTAKARWAAVNAWTQTAGLALWHALPEVLTAAAFLVGWFLLTYGVAGLTTPLVWPISGGLLLLSLGGWRMLYRLACDGLYVLTKAKRG